MWPLPQYVEPDWSYAPGKTEQKALANILTDGRFVCDDGWEFRSEVLATRYIRYPFYPGAFSIEIQIDLPFGEGRAIGSWLIFDGAPADTPSDDDESINRDEGEAPNSTYFLNGSSPPIHEVNAKLPVSIPDRETAQAYLKFFCAHVWADAGGFWIVSEPRDIPFEMNADLSAYAEFLEAIRNPEYQGTSDDGHFLFKVWVCYGGALFVADVAVQSSGMVDMLDDENIIEKMEVFEDKRIGGLRVFQAN